MHKFSNLLSYVQDAPADVLKWQTLLENLFLTNRLFLYEQILFDV